MVVDLQPAQHQESEPEHETYETALRRGEAGDRELVRLPGRGEVDHRHRDHRQGVGRHEHSPPEEIEPGSEDQGPAEGQQRLGQDEEGEDGLEELEVDGRGRLQGVARHHQRVVGRRIHQDQGRAAEKHDDRPLSQRVEPSQAHRLVGQERLEIVKVPLRSPPEPRQEAVTKQLSDALAKKPERDRAGEHSRDEQPDMQEIRVHAQEAALLLAEEPVLQRLLQLMADEALVAGGRGDERREPDRDGQRGSKPPHDSVEAYSSARARACRSGTIQVWPSRRTRPSRS